MTDYGLTGKHVAQAEAQLKFAKEVAEKARLEDLKQPTYAENQARIQAERKAHAEREAAEEARRLESKLRQRYLAVPGATEDGWQGAKDRLLREYREQAALGTAPDLSPPKGSFADPKFWGL